jgi:hypothetical protein
VKVRSGRSPLLTGDTSLITDNVAEEATSPPLMPTATHMRRVGFEIVATNPFQSICRALTGPSCSELG